MSARGFKRLSSPSVKLTGVVVSVKSELPVTSRINLEARKAADNNPSFVIIQK